jgi:fructan beta-fructosidase
LPEGAPSSGRATATDASETTDSTSPTGAEDSSLPDAVIPADATPYGGPFPGDGGWGADADYPYYPTNYDEPYRGQYHFTAPNGWLNDVNGVWYYGGVFHLSYQAYPYTLDGLTKHWGHATSTDMVHWVSAPVMLDPGVRGLPGDAWSGSAVVDVDNTSGLQTGTNPVLVAIYTATSEGTCLAYSNDLGLTWQPYAGNPLPIGGESDAERDPHVFWHEPTQQWVCAHYENGTAFAGLLGVLVAYPVLLHQAIEREAV